MGSVTGHGLLAAGDTVRARAYADSSLATSRAQALATPDNAELQVLYGLMLAYLKKGDEARAQYAKALALQSNARTQNGAYSILNAARIELALGNKEAALTYLERLRRENGNYSRYVFQLDPTYASLKGNPRFEALLK